LIISEMTSDIQILLDEICASNSQMKYEAVLALQNAKKKSR